MFLQPKILVTRSKKILDVSIKKFHVTSTDRRGDNRLYQGKRAVDQLLHICPIRNDQILNESSRPKY